MPGETLSQVDPSEIEEQDHEQKEQKTYFLDGKIQSVWAGSQTAEVTVRPFQGSRELLSDDSIDSSSTGLTKITVLPEIVEGKKEGDPIQISSIMITERGLITKDAFEELYGAKDEAA